MGRAGNAAYHFFMTVAADAGVERKPPSPIRTIAASLLRLIAVVAVTVTVVIFHMSEGVRRALEMRAEGGGLIVLAVLFWAAAAALRRRRLVSVREISVLLLIGLFGVFAAAQVMLSISHSPTKRTAADIRTIATAVEAFAVDNNRYPQARSIDELARQLEPRYVKAMPREDGWGFPFKYEWEKTSKADTLFVGSAGEYGRWEHAHLNEYTRHENRGPEDDIVYTSGEFICGPRLAR